MLDDSHWTKCANHQLFVLILPFFYCPSLDLRITWIHPDRTFKDYEGKDYISPNILRPDEHDG